MLPDGASDAGGEDESREVTLRAGDRVVYNGADSEDGNEAMEMEM